ncbi:hypothetical protein HK102_001636 [Quaeritorhiza haematococci]|nr:hypothetical protein HK102_001636 [Quaeritorhiza haematococci]
MIREDLGISIDDAFESFDKTPVGVGAVAQVYRADLKDTNGAKSVAVKVLHPYAKSSVEQDLSLLRLAASILGVVPKLRYLSIPDEIETFSKMMRDQLDLRVEASNLEKFRKNFADRLGISFPEPVWELTSENVLVESFEDGIPLHKFLLNGPTVYDHKLAELGVKTFMQMLFVDNFGHGDMHPGNVLISFSKRDKYSDTHKRVDRQVLDTLKTATQSEWNKSLEVLENYNYEPHFIVLDVGLVNRLSDANLAIFQEVFEAGLDFDGDRLGEVMINKCRNPSEVVDPLGAKEKMRDLMSRLKMDAGGRLPLSAVHTAGVIKKFTEFIREHRIRMDGEFIGIFVCSVLVEGIGRRLQPEMDLLEALATYT